MGQNETRKKQHNSRKASHSGVSECEADIGEFVAVLCQPESSYISGQSIAVDGGQAYMG